MQKYVIAAIALIAIVGAGIYLYESGHGAYVETIEGEVAQLEEDLAEIDAMVNAGGLSAEDAEAARVRIITRIDAINAAVDSSSEANLSEADKRALLDALGKLKDVLIRYESTLNAVEDSLPEDSMTQASNKTTIRHSGSGGSNRGSLAAIIAEAVDVLEAHAEEVVEDFEAEDSMADDSDEDAMNDDADDDQVVDEDGATGTPADDNNEDNMENPGSSEDSDGTENATGTDPENS